MRKKYIIALVLTFLLFGCSYASNTISKTELNSTHLPDSTISEITSYSKMRSVNFNDVTYNLDDSYVHTFKSIDDLETLLQQKLLIPTKIDAEFLLIMSDDQSGIDIYSSNIMQQDTICNLELHLKLVDNNVPYSISTGESFSTEKYDFSDTEATLYLYDNNTRVIYVKNDILYLWTFYTSDIEFVKNYFSF